MNASDPLLDAISPPSAGPSVTGRSESRRFTLDGDAGLERHLELTCQRVLSGVRGLIPSGKLEALLLGGGYGRGEGGVLREATGDRPYNDLEFYVVIHGNRHLNEARYGRALEVLGEILTHLADLEVEFKITSLAELRALPISMFSYDLFSGHRLLWGEQRQLRGCEHHLPAAQIPLAEATRLLMNRGTGLLLSRAKLMADPLAPGDADFVRRNIAKAALACGDAVLTARGLYDWSCRERHRQLERIARLEPSLFHDLLLREHTAGVELKLHPDGKARSREALRVSFAEVTDLMRQCWLWIESRRLGCEFTTTRAYAQHPSDKCPDTPRGRNLLLNLRSDGFRPHWNPRPWRHPRQRIFHSLALLLWDPAATTQSPTRAQVQRELHTRATSLADLVRAYTVLWARVR